MNYFLQIADTSLSYQDKADIEDLEQQLAKVIKHLLDNDINKLMNALYRIDISESVFKKIVSQAPSEKINVLLAQEIIKRELQKLETREKYKNYFK